jgi:hypothetical protein
MPNGGDRGSAEQAHERLAPEYAISREVALVDRQDVAYTGLLRQPDERGIGQVPSGRPLVGARNRLACN